MQDLVPTWVNMSVLQQAIVCRYDSSTGTFTVPPGGDGFYYFSVYFGLFWDHYAYFEIEINGEVICTAEGDESESTFTDRGHTSCSGATFAVEG